MEQTNFPISRNLPLERLVTDALGEIERLGYSRRSRNRYRAIWDHLIEFSDRKELGDEFSGELAVRFLEEYRVADEEMDKPGEGWRRHMVWGVKVLADFAQNGRVERSFTEVEAIRLVPVMQQTLRDYEQYCKEPLANKRTQDNFTGQTVRCLITQAGKPSRKADPANDRSRVARR